MGKKSKVNWDNTEWDPLATKKRPLRPKGFGSPKAKRKTTKETILDIYEQMETGDYKSPLWPPPGDPRAAHHPSSRFRIIKDDSND